MAIVGITPTFMSPMAFRDSAQELAQQSREGAAALQNAFKFGTQVYDYAKNRQIGNALKEGNLDKAALLESQKINQQDPSVLWRWNQGQKMQQAQIDEAKAQRAADAQKANDSLMNETESLLKNVTSQNPEAQAQYINNLYTQRAKVKNAGGDTTAIDAKIAEVTEQMQGGLEQRQADVAKAEEAKQIKETYSKTTGDIEKQIGAGATESAWKMAQEAWKAGIIDDKDLVRYKEQIKAKNEATNWERHGKSQQLKNEKKQAQKDADDDWASKLF